MINFSVGIHQIGNMLKSSSAFDCQKNKNKNSFAPMNLPPLLACIPTVLADCFFLADILFS